MLKDVEVIEKFSTQLESGNAFVIAYGEPKESGYQALYFVQSKEKGGNKSVLGEKLRGWKNGIIARAVESMYLPAIANKTKAEQDALKKEFAIGAELVSYDIQVQEKFTPSYDGQEPRKNREGAIVYSNGKPFYQHSTVVNKGEAIDIYLEVDKVVVGASVPKAEKEFAGFN